MITRIEQAIVAHLEAAAATGALGYRYRTLETYPVDWDAYINEKGGGLPAPGAWVTFAGWRVADSEDAGRGRVIATFGLVVMAQNLRDETSTRQGGPDEAREPGSYRMAVDAARLMVGQDFGLAIDGLQIGALRFVARLPAWESRKVSMLALELITGFNFRALSTDPEELLADFATFHANWDIPPFGNVDRAIPSDDTADASDHVELETETP